ncbi:MAG: hypothetical protein FK730_15255 [Asgard group archaeon]|nr:hypothetical protein [Asgard group archaeon]
MKKKSITILSISFLILFSSTSIINKKIAFYNPHANNLLLGKGILGKDLLESNDHIDSKVQDMPEDEEPIFWDLDDGDIIIYNPVVLFVNYYYWDNLPFYNNTEEYVFEMYANESTIFDESNPYSRYNQYYWYLGYDWNISSYEPGTLLNITVFFYQENNQNLNHSAMISVTIGELKETPTIDTNEFIIDLFHWPGSLFTYGYYFYQPTGYNSYYHFAIYPDGYVELKYGDLELYDSKDLSGSEAKELMQELINLGFFQLKDAYFSPGYDYYYQSYYQIAVKSIRSGGEWQVEEWRQIEECADFILRPIQYMKCLQAIKDRIDYLYFTPLRWKWDLFFIIAGSSLGGLGTIFGAIYLFTRYRRRRY